jgi:hypothetical protein
VIWPPSHPLVWPFHRLRRRNLGPASPDFPGERLIVCRNPDLAAERTRKREDLLVATEKDLASIKAAA